MTVEVFIQVCGIAIIIILLSLTLQSLLSANPFLSALKGMKYER